VTHARAFPLVALALAACGGGNATKEGAEAPARPASDESPVRAAEEEPPKIEPPPELEQPAEEPPAQETPRPKRREPTRKAEVNPKVDPKLAARIKKTFGESCRLERICGDLLGIDCKAAVDGPYYYVKPGSLEKVSTCGGACMGGRCTNCPPAEWDCDTY